NGTTVGCSVRSGLRTFGTTTPTPLRCRDATSAGTDPGVLTYASLLTKRYASAGSIRAPMVLALPKRTLVSTRTKTEPASWRDICDQWWGVGPFSTTTILSLGTPSATRDSTQRTVWSGRFQSTTTTVSKPSQVIASG